MSSDSALGHPVAGTRQLAQQGHERLLKLVGGPARFRVVVVLAGVLALDGADKGTVSATADNLKTAFHINNTDIGLLVTVTALIGALFTMPVGVLTDRIRRTRLLAISIATWAVAMFFSGAAQSFVWLILARLALGAVTATAGPTIGSLTGDYFPAKDRARMYGFILAGELIGTGFGFVVSGFLAAHLDWRYSFWWLMIPSLVLAFFVYRLAEPARGGQSRIHAGEEEIRDEREVADADEDQQREEEQQALLESREGVAEKAIEESGAEPYPDLVLHESPRDKNLWWAVKYILRVRTDVVIIIASSLGYFYFAGLRTFAIIFAQDHYGISKSMASSLVLVVGIGGLVGVYAGGRVADRLVERGVATGRVIVPVVVLLSISAVLAPAFWSTSLWVALPLLTVGAALLGSANPPQDAARLDIIHPHLWGRSEGVRTALRLVFEAAAPVTFGWVSDNFFGGNVTFGGGSSRGGNAGLADTFLVFLVVLVAAGLIVIIALRTYPRDVATANASVEATLGMMDDDESSTYPGGGRDHADGGAVSRSARRGPRRSAPAMPAPPTDRSPGR